MRRIFKSANFAGKQPIINNNDNTISEELADAYRATIEVLASAIASKDSYEKHHIKRVQVICEQIAKKLKLDQDVITGIQFASLLHDVGKLGVPEYILLKPGPLDQEEFTKISNHAAIGAKILEDVKYPWNVTEMVRHHHENFDGSGYPDHLAGDQIPIGARIIAVAEVYDSLISERCYRHGWSHQDATDYIRRFSGIRFDPQIADVLAELDLKSVLEDKFSSNKSSELDNSCANSAAAEMISQANKELLSIFDIADTISSTLELDEVLGLLASKAKRLTNAATCVVLLRDEVEPRKLVARTTIGRYQDLFDGAQARFGKGVTGKAASRVRPFVGSYDCNDLVFMISGTLAIKFKSCMIAPIVNMGEVIGTINLYDNSSCAFSNDDARTLSVVANRAAVAIENARAFENVRDSSLKDSVTGLYNPRYLRIYLEHEINRAARRKEELSVLGIDLDNFKAVNDSYGHNKGDVVLKDAAEIFQSQLRDYDLVVRSGGDEFVIILPGTSADEAECTADRIKREIEQYAKDTLGGNTVGLGVSVGIATYPDDACELETLLDAADAAMYRDKRARKQGKLAA